MRVDQAQIDAVAQHLNADCCSVLKRFIKDCIERDISIESVNAILQDVCGACTCFVVPTTTGQTGTSLAGGAAGAYTRINYSPAVALTSAHPAGNEDTTALLVNALNTQQSYNSLRNTAYFGKDQNTQQDAMDQLTKMIGDKGQGDPTVTSQDPMYFYPLQMKDGSQSANFPSAIVGKMQSLVGKAQDLNLNAHDIIGLCSLGGIMSAGKDYYNVPIVGDGKVVLPGGTEVPWANSDASKPTDGWSPPNTVTMSALAIHGGAPLDRITADPAAMTYLKGLGVSNGADLLSLGSNSDKLYRLMLWVISNKRADLLDAFSVGPYNINAGVSPLYRQAGAINPIKVGGNYFSSWEELIKYMFLSPGDTTGNIVDQIHSKLAFGAGQFGGLDFTKDWTQLLGADGDMIHNSKLDPSQMGLSQLFSGMDSHLGWNRPPEESEILSLPQAINGGSSPGNWLGQMTRMHDVLGGAMSWMANGTKTIDSSFLPANLMSAVLVSQANPTDAGWEKAWSFGVGIASMAVSAMATPAWGAMVSIVGTGIGKLAFGGWDQLGGYLTSNWSSISSNPLIKTWMKDLDKTIITPVKDFIVQSGVIKMISQVEGMAPGVLGQLKTVAAMAGDVGSAVYHEVDKDLNQWRSDADSLYKTLDQGRDKMAQATGAVPGLTSDLEKQLKQMNIPYKW